MSNTNEVSVATDSTINALIQATRQYLVEKGPSTVTEIVKAVDVSRADVLAALTEARGVVFIETVPPRTGKRGRPQSPRWSVF